MNKYETILAAINLNDEVEVTILAAFNTGNPSFSTGWETTVALYSTDVADIDADIMDVLRQSYFDHHAVEFKQLTYEQGYWRGFASVEVEGLLANSWFPIAIPDPKKKLCAEGAENTMKQMVMSTSTFHWKLVSLNDVSE